MFTKFTRPEGKGSLLLNSDHVVIIFEAQQQTEEQQTVVRTTAGGENINFVVAKPIEEVVSQLSACGAAFIHVNRSGDGRTLFINVDQIVGVYERGGLATIRTTASGTHAEYSVIESIDTIEEMLVKEDATQPSSAVLPVKARFRKPKVASGS
ncbi:hypothetical protein ADU59_27395 [Pararhizobium polonicum]|uniref:Uncharacterized protein n=1 Tax=Pararhizobium polonicum TaxID=1612624 RepID=A0A1C7NTB2_9HYPH|nr:hypothetical protein [Pararhizobium polonicum]OBZ92228.1 hypothetical protein ADU59_27395 [Pararhizobium polonicum]